MAAYRVEFSSKALRQLDQLAAHARARMVARAEALAPNPRPSGVVKLSGYADRYRVRAGQYRIVYEIRERVLVVLVLAVGHRKSVYKDG